MTDLAERQTDIAETRLRSARVYQWFSLLLEAPPDGASIAAYRRGGAAALLDEVAALPGCSLGIALMRSALDGEASDQTIAARLARAYGLLFEGLGGPRTISLYESVHRPGGRLFGPPAAEMDALLAAHDLSVARNEPADHISIELALLARLIALSDSGPTAMLERLAGWVPSLASACAQADDTGFWAGATQALARRIEYETRRFGDAEMIDALA